jgi:ribosome-binding factor A
MTEQSRRAKRVAEAVRDHVAKFLVTHVADSRLSQVVITDARVSDDLGVVHLAFRAMSGSFTTDEQAAILHQLQRVTGRLRKTLAPELRLRRVPEIRFVVDKGYDAQKRVQELLDEIRKEPK